MIYDDDGKPQKNCVKKCNNSKDSQKTVIDSTLQNERPKENCSYNCSCISQCENYEILLSQFCYLQIFRESNRILLRI